MTGESIVRIVSYITSSSIFLVGVIVLSGTLLPLNVPENYRYILGGAMVIYGTYRVTMIRAKHRQAKQSANAEQR